MLSILFLTFLSCIVSHLQKYHILFLNVHLKIICRQDISLSVCVYSLYYKTYFSIYRKGHVVVVELSTEKGSRQKPERLRLISDHVQSTVTSITWDTTGSKLYTGDNLGRIYATSIPSTKVIY